mmetsp:Transcript_853/g.1380  ORF Transcript_853/g.1380 Transcript_853/m.1380 type:complete len:263 (+) Transcript_853:55-843(+)
MTLTFGTPPPIAPPGHLPDPTSFLQFGISEKKNEIFQAARTRISNSAQFTKSRRKPWTQITVHLPIKAGSQSQSTDDEDLAVIWSLLKDANIYDVKENENNGDWTWTICGSDAFLEWLNVDWKNAKPADKFVHPVHFETGARKKTLLETKLKKARASGDVSLAMRLERELEDIVSVNAAAAAVRPTGHDYHWADYEECIVSYKKKQTRKAAHNELQLTVKIRTYHLGTGDPRENNGYLRGSSRSLDLDPESNGYKLIQMCGF